ncbi:uncharacterized protein LOC122527619 [Frieseomelitta varia]|uniref:uncharacterized protein LOC122527619 n=1 Tax=Frieseomelitta varia TaxID=561572 RepID=UPI001CB6845A|nr:uncharacterized protein LOC122527619 [Frieseomelitta varia]
MKVVYVALCVYAYSSVAITITHVDNPYMWKISEDIETSQRSKETDDEPVGISFQKKLIPIREPRIGKNFQTLRMPLEPDAEILPAHYTGIKPPGVDHMELRHADTRIVPKIESLKTFEQAETQRPSEHQESDSLTGEKSQKDDTLRKTTKTQREETGGEKKPHEGRKNESNKQTEQIGSKEGNNNKEKDRGQVDRKVAGYRNIYHKDEYKKDHDFYDNDDHGGHSKKHGNYREKYVASEGAFNKGSARDSGFDEAELREQGISGESRAGEETKAHETRNGRDGFFKNFHGFREAGSQKRR